MLTLNDGRSELWQWDTGRKLTVDAECSQVHFSNKVFGRSVDVDVVDGVAIIPDILLQTDKELAAWAFVGTAENGYTKISKVFKVNKRNKPANYVFTPPEQTSLEQIKEKLDYLESIQDPDAIKNAVEDYLDRNPVEAPVQSVNGKTGKIKLTAEDVGAISQDKLQEATNEALAQAKESGEFDGKDGVDGKDGQDGYTPQKNVDYFDGADGEDGGYYTPAVTQLDEDTVQFDFTPSKPDMPAVNPVTVELPAGQDSGGNADLTGYATEQYVQEYAQPKGDYLTEVPDGYAKTEDIPTKPEDIGAQPAGNYLTEVPSGYATEEFVRNKIAEAELGGEEVDLSGYAQKSEIPTKTSQLTNDNGYLTEVPEGYAKTSDIPTKPEDINAQPAGNYALKTEIPTVPQKVSAFTNDAGYLTQHQDISGKADVAEVASYITPEMYGAKGDGTTDDSAAIQAAINAAGSTNIVYLGRKTYAIATGLQIVNSNRRFYCEGKLSYSGDGAAVTIGSHTIIVDIDEINAPNGTAIKVAYANKYIEKCMVSVGRIASSKIGLHLYTDTVSITYNQFKIGYISASEIGVYVECQASYINENWYWLGKITGCKTGIKLFSAETLESHTGMGTNSNRFFSGALEGLSEDGCAIHISNSCGNKFEELRVAERYGKNSLIIEGRARWNDIEIGLIRLLEIDISNFTGGHSNTITAMQVTDKYNGFHCGRQAKIDYPLGITYDSSCANVDLALYDGMFDNNVISQFNALIPNVLYFLDDSLNGTTYTLGDIYSNYLSMARGNPVTVTFSETGGRIALNDINGDVIVDNREGKYAGKTVSVQWAGYEKTGDNNIWSVIEREAAPLYESDLQAAVDNALAQAKASGEFDGTDGTSGKDGSDGVSPTVAVSKSGKVTTVSITDKNGTKTATINDGTDGSNGSDGKDGTSVTVKSVSESTEDGGSNVVTFSDGKSVTIKNGSNGSKGDKGDAYTLTDTDKASIATAVKASLAKENWTFTLEDGSTVTKAVYVG